MPDPLFAHGKPGLWVRTLEVSTQACGLALAAAGAAALAYAAYICIGLAGSPWPWPICAFGAAGLLVAATAALGLAGSWRRSAACVNGSGVLQCLALAAQTCVAVELFGAHAWGELLPPDAPQFERLRALLLRHLGAAKWLGASACILQVLALALGWALHAAYASAAERREEEEEAEEGAAARRAPLLDRCVRGGALVGAQWWGRGRALPCCAARRPRPAQPTAGARGQTTQPSCRR
jgi:hypothetical protein